MWRLLWKHREWKSDSQRNHFLGKKDRAWLLKCPGRTAITQADCKGKQNNSGVVWELTETSALKAKVTSDTVGHRIPHASAGILRTFYPPKWHSDSTSLPWETSWLLYITYRSSIGLFYWVKRQQLYEWKYRTWRWRRHVSPKHR